MSEEIRPPTPASPPSSVPEEVEEEKPLFDLRDFLRSKRERGEPLTLSEAYLIRAMMREDRLERLEMQKQNQPPPVNVEEAVEKAISKVLEKFGEKINPKNSEPTIPKELTIQLESLQKQVNSILEKFKEQEQAERDKQLIEKAQEPLMKRYEELVQRYGTLEEKLKTLLESKTLTPQQTATVNQTISEIKQTLQDIKETAKLMGLKEPNEVEKPTSAEGKYGEIPVSGSIPAWAVAIPKIINDVLENIDKRAALWLRATPTESKLLNLPSRPTPQLPEAGELLKLPKPPTISEPPVTPEPTVLSTTQVAEPTKPIELPTAAEKPEKLRAKEYQCKICGAQFPKPHLLASHMRHTHKRERKKEEEKRQQEEKKPLTTPTQSLPDSEKQ